MLIIDHPPSTRPVAAPSPMKMLMKMLNTKKTKKLLVLERCGLLKERSILIDFRGKHRGFDFDFFWLPKMPQYGQ